MPRIQRATLWLLDQTHIVVTALTALIFFKTRSAHVGYFIAGAVGVNTFAKLSKNIIRQDRPNITIDDPDADNTGRPKKKVKKTYGMPSTHSTSIGFYMSYLVLSLLTSPPRSRSEHEAGIKEGLLALGTIAWGTAIMWSRVRIGYHTPAQVLVGAAIGLFGGVGWRMLWDRSVVGYWEGVLQGLVNRGFGVVGL